MERPVAYEYLAGAYDRTDGTQFSDYARPRAGAPINAGGFDQPAGSSAPAFVHAQHPSQQVEDTALFHGGDAHGHASLPPLAPLQRHYASASLDPLDDDRTRSAEPVSAVSMSSNGFDQQGVHTMPSPSNSGSRTSTHEPSPPPKSRRRKKGKDSIPLAPDQPLTSQGTTRQRVYLACVQWCVNPVLLAACC
jgi:hypothetical protein